MSLSNYSVANSISYEVLKSDVPRVAFSTKTGCGDKTRTQKQVCEIFNTKYPDRRISQSTVSRIENKFREFGNATDIPKSDIQDNPHKLTRQVVADNDVSKTSILRLLKNEKYRSYKIHLVQELNDDVRNFQSSFYVYSQMVPPVPLLQKSTQHQIGLSIAYSKASQIVYRPPRAPEDYCHT
ncbi:hypothetical protein NQ318_002141 [Aromia moschata]|uniref:DUF4817 domain-containing protein n=1 Tax=Aromia moschata TaxID=1265417 RepID=A0AAV8XZC6_9CUCU|nr:hypothetical protein NQ318_002141 [Aromia moschata]